MYNPYFLNHMGIEDASQQLDQIMRQEALLQVIKKEEIKCLSGASSLDGLLGYLDELKASSGLDARSLQMIASIRSFYEGMAAHIEANARFGRFNSMIAKSPGGQRMRRQGIRKLYEDFNDRETMEMAENDALEKYNQAIAGGSGLVELKEINASIIDLEYRQAQRIEDQETRSHKLKELDGRLEASCDGNHGKAAEYKLISLLRLWAQDKKLDHLAQFYHGTAMDDKKHGIDMTVFYEGRVVNVSLKMDDANIDDANQFGKMLEDDRKKIQGTNVIQIVLEKDIINTAYLRRNDRHNSGVASRFFNELATKVMRSIEQSAMIVSEKRAKNKGPIPRLTPENLMRLCDRSVLERMGEIEQGRVYSADQILAIKKQLINKVCVDKDPYAISSLNKAMAA